MLIRKNKVIREIDAMIEDANYYIDQWSCRNAPDEEYRVQSLKAEIDVLETLRYFLKYNERYRPLKKSISK